MSAQRTIRRAQQREAAKGARQAQPPTAGAVDLQTLKGGDKALQEAALEQQLLQAGFACPCGERFGEKAIQAVGWILGRFPEARPVQTPQGPPRALVLVDGVRLRVMSFCSRTCVEYLDALKNGMPVPDDSGLERPRVRAVRSIPPVQWLEEEAEVDK